MQTSNESYASEAATIPQTKVALDRQEEYIDQFAHEHFDSMVIDATEGNKEKTISVVFYDGKTFIRDYGDSVSHLEFKKETTTKKDVSPKTLIIKIDSSKSKTTIKVDEKFKGKIRFLAGQSCIAFNLERVPQRKETSTKWKEFLNKTTEKPVKLVEWASCMSDYIFEGTCSISIQNLEDHVLAQDGCSVNLSNPLKGKFVYFYNAKNFFIPSLDNVFALGMLKGEINRTDILQNPRSDYFINLTKKDGPICLKGGNMSRAPCLKQIRRFLKLDEGNFEEKNPDILWPIFIHLYAENAILLVNSYTGMNQTIKKPIIFPQNKEKIFRLLAKDEKSANFLEEAIRKKLERLVENDD